LATSTDVAFLFVLLFNKEQIALKGWNPLCNQDGRLPEGRRNISFHRLSTECRIISWKRNIPIPILSFSLILMRVLDDRGSSI
jgi:hypothetical protein